VTARLLRPLLLAAGVAVVAWLVWDLGPAAVWESIHTLSWRLGLVVLFPFCLAVAFDTLGWRVLLPECRVAWGTLAAARLAGEAANLLTPTASVGGEPLKAYLVRDRLPLALGLASVVVDKTTVVMGQAAFLAAGLAVALLALEPSKTVAIAMAALLAVEILGVGGFALVQIRGGIAGAGRILRRLGVGRAESHRELLREMDVRLARLYRERRARVLLSALLHTLGWAVGGLEIYLVLTLAGIPVSLATALVLEAVGCAVRFATFLIPGSLGALEGGNVAIFAAFGLPGAAGLSFSLVRRLREATWALVGLGALAGFKSRPAGPPAVETDP
jgi:glycosyltransferase 2 family protein